MEAILGQWKYSIAVTFESFQEYRTTEKLLGIRCRVLRRDCDGRLCRRLYPMAPPGYQSQRASGAERQPRTRVSRDSGSQWDVGRSRSVWLRPLMLCCWGELRSWVDCQVALISHSELGRAWLTGKRKHCILLSLILFLGGIRDLVLKGHQLSQKALPIKQ